VDTLDNKYQIEQLLGKGGMGAVYRATHLGTKRTVAVKVIHPQLSAHDQFVARFRREAEAAGRLRHPNVVDVTDFGIAHTGNGPVAYLVMEYLDGCTLAEIVAEEGALPIAWVIDILEQVCAAVEEAHRAGIIHRDLKPDNIWLEPNGRGGYTVKVLDFGLVKLGGAEEIGRGFTRMNADLRESGALEQDADVVAFIFREEQYKTAEEREAMPEDRKNIAELIIAKQRNGPTGTVDLRFTPSSMRFDNLYRE